MTQETTPRGEAAAPAKTPAKRGLGRGLSALIPQAAASVGIVSRSAPGIALEPEGAGEAAPALEGLRRIPLRAVSLNPMQPRKTFGREELEELESSIREHGVLQPVVVRPKLGSRPGKEAYELVAGERRFRAASNAGLEDIPAVVREMNDSTSLAIALIENIQREDLNIVETAQGYEQLLHEFQMTQTELAQAIGKSQPQIANAIRILGLPLQILDSLRDGHISDGHAKVILSVPETDQRTHLWALIVDQRLTVRESEREAAKLRSRDAAPRVRVAAPVDSQLEDIGRRISLNMGTKVRLVPGKGQKGTIEIAYYDHDQLEGLIERLSGEK